MAEKQTEDYFVTHLGDGKFQVTLEDGNTYEAGSNLCGMIRYTYFEDYKLPEVGWGVTRKQLLEDYFPKATRDLKSGKIKPNRVNY